MTSKIRIATGETWEYNYNHENRLVGVTKRDASSGPAVLKVWSKYDVQGNRIEKTVDPDGDGPQSATSTRFTYTEDGNAWADLDASGNITTRRMYLEAVDALFARIGSGDPEWYLTDHLGSVRQIADSSGAILDEITYDGFGAILSESSPTTGDRYKYTGREWDTETQLQYNRARYYDPTTRRWISQDPLGFDAGDGNLYRYVFNSSTRFSDPSGEVVPLVVGAIVIGGGCLFLSGCSRPSAQSGVESVTVTDKGFGHPTIGRGPTQLGPRTFGQNGVGYPFMVRIVATEPITNVKVRQRVFIVTRAQRNDGSWDYGLVDAAHPVPASGLRSFNVGKDAADRAKSAFENDRHTFTDDWPLNKAVQEIQGGQRIQGFNITISQDGRTLSYTEPFGFFVDARKYRRFEDRFVFQIQATGTDGRTVTAEFWGKLIAESRNGQWVFVQRFRGTRLPQTWR